MPRCEGQWEGWDGRYLDSLDRSHYKAADKAGEAGGEAQRERVQPKRGSQHQKVARGTVDKEERALDDGLAGHRRGAAAVEADQALGGVYLAGECDGIRGARSSLLLRLERVGRICHTDAD